MRFQLALVPLLALTALACSDDQEPAEPGARSAKATLTSTAGNTATGTITFTTTGSQVKASVQIANVTPSSVHGFHLHVNPACGADGMEAGGHWDPTTMMHGEWTSSAHHHGDIGNITVDATGAGSLELTTDLWSIGTGAANDVVAHSAVLHANPDDYVTQPTGNAGGRIACGVIQLVQ